MLAARHHGLIVTSSPRDLLRADTSGFRGYAGIVIIGASGAGKSTLLARIRTALSEDLHIAFPTRLTTRKPRKDDESWENATVSREELDSLTSNSGLLLRWAKRIEPGRTEHYAFRKADHAVVILGGNDELISNSESILPNPDILDSLIKVVVVCDQSIRALRLMARSPELEAVPGELQTRLKATPTDVLSRCDARIDTSTGIDQRNIDALAEVVRRIRNEGLRTA